MSKTATGDHHSYRNHNFKVTPSSYMQIALRKQLSQSVLHMLVFIQLVWILYQEVHDSMNNCHIAVHGLVRQEILLIGHYK